jgi:hypothetical protein
MESIQCMAPEGSPLLALAQQGAEATNHVIAAERSMGNYRREPSVGNQPDGRVKCARSEAAASARGDCRLADNDACRWITQNYRQREYGRDHDDLYNVIDDCRRPLHNALQHLMLPHQGGAVSVLWLHGSGRSSGQRSLSPSILTSTMTLAIQKNSSRSIILSLRPQE